MKKKNKKLRPVKARSVGTEEIARRNEMKSEKSSTEKSAASVSGYSDFAQEKEDDNSASEMKGAETATGSYGSKTSAAYGTSETSDIEGSSCEDLIEMLDSMQSDK